MYIRKPRKLFPNAGNVFIAGRPVHPGTHSPGLRANFVVPGAAAAAAAGASLEFNEYIHIMRPPRLNSSACNKRCLLITSLARACVPSLSLYSLFLSAAWMLAQLKQPFLFAHIALQPAASHPDDAKRDSNKLSKFG